MNASPIRAVVAMAILGIVSLRAHAALPATAYTLRELLDRSFLIAIGEAAPLDGAPPSRAVHEGLLRLSTVLKGDAGPGLVRFVVDGPPLPAGARAIWFLHKPNENGVYTIDHPQCAYDVAHRTLLEIAIKKPEMIKPQYYLRKEDERLAVDIRKERERRALGAIPESNSADGLSLALRVLSAPARAGGSITVEFIFTNNSLVDILLCDSSEECYFLRAQHPTDASVHIGPAGADSLDIEKTLDLGPLITEHDFITLVPGQSFSKRMSVSARSVPPLASPGRVRVAGIYRYTHDSQAGLALQGNPWEGALVSPAVDAELLPPPPPVRRSPVMP